MKSLVLLMFLLGSGCSPEGDSSENGLPSVNMSAIDNDVYKQLYFDYRASVIEAISNSDTNLLNQITDDFIDNADYPIEAIYLNKVNRSGERHTLLTKRDPSRLPRPLPLWHYGKIEEVHITRIDKSDSSFIMLETGKTIERKYSNGIHIKMVIGPNKKTLLTTDQ